MYLMYLLAVHTGPAYPTPRNSATRKFAVDPHFSKARVSLRFHAEATSHQFSVCVGTPCRIFHHEIFLADIEEPQLCSLSLTEPKTPLRDCPLTLQK